MNLLLRLIRVILHALNRSKLGIFDTSKLTFWVGPFDLDINRHMTNSRYLSLMDLGRTDLLLRSALGKRVWQNKWSAVLGSATVRWRKPLNIFQKFTLHTQLLGWDEKWVYIDQRIIAEGEVVCHALVKGIFVSKTGSIPITEVLKFTDAEGMPSPTLPESVAHWQAAERNMSEAARNISDKP
jgi:hypothetical protein